MTSSEKEVLENKDFYKSILDGIINGVWVTNADDIIYYTNKGMEKIAGIPANQIVGVHVLKDFPESTLNYFGPYYLKAKDTLKSIFYEAVPVETPAGRQSYQSGWLIPRIKEGKYDGIICTVDDVTERKLAEQKLIDSEKQLLYAQKISRLGFWDWNIITGELYWSDETYRIFGFKPQEFAPSYEKFRSIIHPEDLEFVQNHIDTAIQNDAKYNIDFRLVRPSGEIRYIDAQGDVTRDSNGKAIRFVGTQIDITERKKAEVKLKESEEKYKNLSNELEQKVLERTRELKESEERFRTLFENSPNSIILVDLRGKIIDCNSKTHDLFGYTREDIINKTYLDLMDDSSKFMPIARTRLSNLLKGKQNELLEQKMRRKDGTLIWVSSLSSLVKLGSGIYLQISIQDVTEKKISEQKLKDSEENYRYLNNEIEMIMDRIPGLIFYKDKENRFIRVNKYVADGYKMDKKEIEGKNLFELMPKEVAQAYWDDDLEVMKRIKPKLNYEEPWDTKEGRRWLSTSKIPFVNEEGNIIGIIGFSRDITDQKEAEDKLRESEEKLRTFMESATDTIVLFDSELNFVDYNEATLRLLGLKIEDLIGKNILDIVPNLKETGRYEKYLEVIKTGIPFNTEDIIFNRLDGSLSFYLSNRAFKVGNGLGIIGSDITERKKAEQRLEESEEQYRKAYNLVNFYKDLFAHDMNNILQSILSSSEYYSLFRDDPEKLKDFGDISDIVKMHIGRGTSLINNVRKLSKLEETEIDIMPIGVFTVLNESVENTKNSFHLKNVNIKTEGLSKDLKILGGELMIDVFDNLLNNAVKFTEDGDEVIVDLIISKIQADDINYVKLEFKDYGRGILDNRKENLFIELFERDQFKRGMGMGLSLVKKIVDKYDGKIWVEDRIEGNYKEGSNFIVLLKEAP